jgi:hypothetical protein
MTQIKERLWQMYPSLIVRREGDLPDYRLTEAGEHAKERAIQEEDRLSEETRK